MAPQNKVNPELDEVLARPENRKCADCGAKAPRWASVNLGVFFCLECSGAHRNMGTHISTVKSVTLDKWQPKWISTIKLVGNRIGNSYYEHNSDGQYLKEGESGTAIQDWIQRKYDKKEWAPSGNKPTPGELVAQGRDPDVYDPNHAKTQSAASAGNCTGNDSRAHALPPTLSSASTALAPPAIASNSVAKNESVDLLGGLQEPASASSSPLIDAFPAALTPATKPDTFSSFDLPDVFAPEAAAAMPQPQVVQAQKVDSLKNSLASLYNQAPAHVTVEDRFAALTGPSGGMNTMGGLGGMGHMATGMSNMQRLGGMNAMGGGSSMSALAGMGGAVGGMGAGFGGMGGAGMGTMSSMPLQQAQQRQFLQSSAMGFNAMGNAPRQQMPTTSFPMSDPRSGQTPQSGGAGQTAEVKHADAMKLVLDSFSMSGVKENVSCPAAVNTSSTGYVSRYNHSDQLDIDPFSIYGMRPAIKEQSEPLDAQQTESTTKEQPLTIEQMMKMQSMVEQACVKAY